MYVLHVKVALKAVQPQTSAPELHKRQARLFEKQSLSLAHLRKALHALVTLVGPHEQVTKMGSGFSGDLEQREGREEEWGQYRSNHRRNRCNPFLSRDNLWRGRLCSRRHMASQKYAEQQDEPIVHHRLQ